MSVPLASRGWISATPSWTTRSGASILITWSFAKRIAREESVERHRPNEASEQQQKISSALSRLANFTAEHDLLIVAYLAERDHKQRMRSLERATEARRGQVLALGRLLAMPREALLEHAGFVAFARRLKSKTPQRKRAAKPGRVIERSHDE